MKLRESAENYLETILVLSDNKGYVRAIDIANRLGFAKPSVSVALKNLREHGYVTVEADGNVKLLEKGMRIAEQIYERHRTIAKVLMLMGVTEETAYEDACKIEHDISEESFAKMKAYFSENLAE